MPRLRKRAAHVGRESFKYSYVVAVHAASGFASPVQGLPEGASCIVQIARGPKVVATAPASIALGKAAWPDDEQQDDEAETRARWRKEQRRLPAKQPPQPPQAPLTYGCHPMTAITTDQLRCAYPLLDHERAYQYATAASAKMGGLLGTTCAWAAFLANAAVESKEMTIWKELKVARRLEPAPLGVR